MSFFIFSARGEIMVNKTAGEINQELDALTKRYQELQTKAQEYSNALEQERRKGRTLDNQVSLLKSKVQKTENTIDTLTVQIQRLQLEEQKTRLLIEDRQLDIQETRDTLETMLQNLFELSKRRGLVAFLQYPSVAKYFSEQTTLWQIQRELGRRVEHLQNLKDYLEQEKVALQEQQKSEIVKRGELAVEQEQFTFQKEATAALLRQTKISESRYQKMVNELKQEQSEIDADIKQLEATLREKLRQEQIIRLGQAVFTWPVPKRAITAFFHDPDYPFRNIFEHPAIDIRAAQGSTIVAPANGIVATVRDNGFGYNYLVLIHNDGFSTVYGHVSTFLVKAGDFVVRGQGIALVGGTPGTRGAGNLTTGPHLHFEIRKNGTPVDPLNYLP